MNARARWILALLAAVAALVSLAPTAAAQRGVREPRPLVIGHRGASGYMPEHTLAAYRLAIRLGADYIEPDLVSTKDGVLVARHEPNIGATTDVASHPEFADRKKPREVDGHVIDDWWVADFTLAELRTLRAIQTRGRSTEFDGKFRVPTFQQVIDLARRASKRSGRQIGIYPETKHPTFHQKTLKLPLERRLVRALKRNSLNRRNAPVFIQSFEQANLKQLNRMTKVRLVQLVDAWDVNPDGTLQYVSPSDRPYDWEVQEPERTDTYGYFATDAGLAEIKTYADGIGPWKPYIQWQDPAGQNHSTDLVQRAHAHGLLIHTWTFRDDAFPSASYASPIAELRSFFELGVDGVFTDFPDTGVIAREFFWNS